MKVQILLYKNEKERNVNIAHFADNLHDSNHNMKHYEALKYFTFQFAESFFNHDLLITIEL